MADLSPFVVDSPASVTVGGTVVYALPPWPSDLPQTPYSDENGQSPMYAPTDNTIRTSVDVGPPKLRRRYTAVVEPCTLNFQMNEAEIAILKTFVQDTLQDVLPFTWIDFRTGGAATYRFDKGWASVSHQWDSGDVWDVTITLELLP